MLLHRAQELSIILLLCIGVQWSFLMNGEYRSEVFVKCPTSRIDGRCKHNREHGFVSGDIAGAAECLRIRAVDVSWYRERLLRSFVLF
jgi:hypothetical protein